MSSENGWRLVGATVKDFRRVQLAQIELKGPVNTIAGKNKSGKTCTLEGILEGLKSGRMAGIDVVRHGADEAVITCHLENGDVHLYTKKSQTVDGEWTLEVRDTPDGRKRKDGPSILKQIVSEFVDLTALSNTDGPGRIELLLKALGKKDDLDALNARQKELIEKREERGRQKRDKAGELEGMAVPSKDTPDDPVDTAALLKQRQNLQAQKDSNDRIRQAHQKKLDALSAILTDEERLEAEIQLLADRLQRTRESIKTQKADIEEDKKAIAKLKEPDFSQIDDQLSRASEINQAVSDKKRYKAVADALGQLSAEWDAVQAQVQKVAKDKTALLASLEWPYPGMGISAEHNDLTVDGALWPNLSKAEAAAVSINLAACVSPEFRFGIVKDAAWFDDETMAEVDRMATAKDFWIFKEVPGDIDDATVVLQDGRAVAGSAVTP